jgi:hypothetical protein
VKGNSDGLGPCSLGATRAAIADVSVCDLPPVIGGVGSAVWTGTPDGARCQRLNARVTAFSHNVRMSERYPLTLRQADEARADFAVIDSDLQFIIAQLARIPTRKEQARNTLGIIFATVVDPESFLAGGVPRSRR